MSKIDNYLSKATICPDCKHTEFAIVLTNESNELLQYGKFGPILRKVSLVCKNCGLVVKEYVDKPERLI